MRSWLEQLCRQLTHQAEQTDARCQAIIGFLDRHLHSDPSLGDLGDHLHLSRDWTGHLVRQLTGRSFQALKQQRRLLVAQQALADSDATIATIAQQAGYRDADYFCRSFKRSTGMTPSQYRQQHHINQLV